MPTTRPSFLEAVLANAGQVEVTDLKERIEEVTQNVAQLKLRVSDYMKSKYVDFDPLLKKTKGFLDKAVRTSDEINALFNRIEFQTKHDLANSTGELRNLHASLKDSSIVLAVTLELLQMEGAMKDVEDAFRKEQFVEAAKALQSFRELSRSVSPESHQLDIFRSIELEFVSLYSQFTRESTDKLYSFISWENTDAANNIVKSTIKIKSGCSSEMQEVAQGLHLLEELDPWINKIRNFFLRSILIPLINNDAIVQVEESETYSSVQVAVKTTSRRPNYSATLDNLTKCFEFLHGELDMQFESGDSFIGLLGSSISEEFTDHLIKDCLKKTVPSCTAELEKYSGIRERVAAFNSYMTGIEFISEENHSLLDYVENFNALCTDKACENYLKTARDIMKDDLQDMVEVGPQSPGVSLHTTLDSTTKETLIDNSVMMQETFANISIKPEHELNQNLFQFPKCFVSKSTLKILDLVSTVLEEATSNSSENRLHQSYIFTAKSIFEMYMAVVPNVHEKLLNSIPQQVALFHNNCMYLAHRLVVLGFEVQASLQTITKEEFPITFVDMVQSLRHLGAVTFLKHMQHQRKQILDIVKESGLATLGENPELSPDTERTIRQCLRQLELLQTVWENVLPKDVYSKCVGVLANAFLEELVVRVSSVEDIPANTAVQLTSIFKMVQERIPKLFEDTNKVVLFVKRWLQFQELINILGASLRDIEESWAAGKGPLAHEFTADQVKQLIRALFQNTQRRADVLSKIK